MSNLFQKHVLLFNDVFFHLWCQSLLYAEVKSRWQKHSGFSDETKPRRLCTHRLFMWRWDDSLRHQLSSCQKRTCWRHVIPGVSTEVKRFLCETERKSDIDVFLGQVLIIRLKMESWASRYVCSFKVYSQMQCFLLYRKNCASAMYLLELNVSHWGSSPWTTLSLLTILRAR